MRPDLTSFLLPFLVRITRFLIHDGRRKVFERSRLCDQATAPTAPPLAPPPQLQRTSRVVAPADVCRCVQKCDPTHTRSSIRRSRDNNSQNSKRKREKPMRIWKGIVLLNIHSSWNKWWRWWKSLARSPWSHWYILKLVTVNQTYLSHNVRVKSQEIRTFKGSTQTDIWFILASPLDLVPLLFLWRRQSVIHNLLLHTHF